MNGKHGKQASWVSILLRLGLVLAILLTSTTIALAGGNKDKDKDKHKRKHEVKHGPVEPARKPTRPQQAARNIREGRAVEREFQGIHAVDPIDLKLLVISADGNETDFQAIKSFLDQIGIPYDTLIATQTTLTPDILWDGALHSYYQGFILTTGNLTYYNAASGQWESAFSDEEWATLWKHEAMFGLRQVTSYTFPYGAPDNYGLNLLAYIDTTYAPLPAHLTAEGQKVFSYLHPTNPITITNAWAYLAVPFSTVDTTPLLVTAEGYALASIHRYPDGRQNLAVTVANNPDLKHSLLLSYGIINWVTKGLFLGERHVYLNPQVDDVLIEDDIWDTQALTDTTGLTYRITGSDFNAVLAWQNRVRSSTPNAGDLMLEMVFNGEGASGIYSPDTLTPVVKANQANFKWVNHTYSHPNLDTISYTLALSELKKNHSVAVNTFGFRQYFRDSMVQPDVSGLYNPEFLRAARDFGIRYLISDTSRPGWNNPSPNAGIYSAYQPSILIIPRHPNNLFYNLTTPEEWVSEYNCYYGPTGTCAGGRFRYWDHDLTYAEILDKESEMWLSYLLKYDLDPLMFHQPNLRAYDGSHTLLGDLINTTLAKYNRVYNLPLRSPSQHQIGILMARRMAYNTSGVRATLIPGQSITLTTSNAAVIPLTGVAYGNNRETYGGQTISYIKLSANQTLSVPAPASTVNATNAVMATVQAEEVVSVP